MAGALLATVALAATGCAGDAGRDGAVTGSTPASVAPDGGSANGSGTPAATDRGTAPGTAPSPPASPPAGPAVLPAGFTTVTVRITEPGGAVCEVCMWLADDGDERGRGLMGVTDLGPAAGMAFVFPEPIEGAFYMFGTPTPLSIAWFAPDGRFVSAVDMEPCTTAAPDCPRYRADAPYDLAVEVFRGGLADLGIDEGAVVEVVAGTEAPECPAAR